MGCLKGSRKAKSPAFLDEFPKCVTFSGKQVKPFRKVRSEFNGPLLQVVKDLSFGMSATGPLPVSSPEDIIGDAGCSMHLIGRDQVTSSDLLRAKVTGKSKSLCTANGQVSINKVLPLRSEMLDLEFKASILDRCPCAISIGQLVSDENEKWNFVWNHKQVPVLTNSQGDRILFKVKNNVPYALKRINATPASNERGEV